LKIAIGSRIIDGPWGGGNLFAKHLTAHLQAKGMEVVHGLSGAVPDIVLLTHATASDSASFTMRELAVKLLLPGWRPLVVHRINNSSDARKDDRNAFNKGRILASRLADHTVFLSEWLRAIYARDGFDSPAWSILMNGGDDTLFKPAARPPAAGKRKLSIVTHHWSNNAKKGFDIYRQLDGYIAAAGQDCPVSFTYIGRLPDGFRFAASTHLDPMSAAQLAVALPAYDIYLTAAQSEAAGMHHIEGALCGLPILYLESGGIPEYCRGFGISYTHGDFLDRLTEMLARYDDCRARMTAYPHTARRMCESYENLFLDLHRRRAAIAAARGSMRLRSLQVLARSLLRRPG
jgi:hypothetical protein